MGPSDKTEQDFLERFKRELDAFERFSKDFSSKKKLLFENKKVDSAA